MQFGTLHINIVENLVKFLKHLSRRQKILVSLAFLTLLILFSKTYESTTYAFFSYSSQALAASQDYATPTFINIPSIELGLPIDETSISRGKWSISDNGASHLSSSPVPGERGNTVLYAKNTPEGFAHITKLKSGDTIIIVTKDGAMHEYEVIKVEVVSPTNSDLINNTDKETLTLYTSHGFGDLKRFVVQATPISLR